MSRRVLNRLACRLAVVGAAGATPCVTVLAVALACAGNESPRDTAAGRSPGDSAAPSTRSTDSASADSRRGERPLISPIGVAQQGRDGTYCLTIEAARLGSGTPIILVSTGAQQRVDTAQVGEPRQQPCTAPGDEWGSVLAPHPAYYTLRLSATAAPEGPVIAVVAPVSPIALRDSAAAGDLDGDGREERFTQCASSEGIHLKVVTPAADGPIVRWQQYFYVPYNLEPTCPAGGV